MNMLEKTKSLTKIRGWRPKLSNSQSKFFVESLHPIHRVGERDRVGMQSVHIHRYSTYTHTTYNMLFTTQWISFCVNLYLSHSNHNHFHLLSNIIPYIESFRNDYARPTLLCVGPIALKRKTTEFLEQSRNIENKL